MRIRTRLPIIAAFFVIAIGAIAGCMREAPLAPSAPSSTVRFSEAVGPVQLVFIERTYDSESDATTYLYQLQNSFDLTAGGAQDLGGILGVFTDVTVELPSCAPPLSGYFPTDGATVGTTLLGFPGITWGVGYDENPNYYYSVTFDGDIPAGTVRGLVTTGGFTYVQNLTGPCAGGFQVSGTVFTDANSNGLLDANEFGVGDVTVKLSDGEGTQTVKTDSEGNYIFIATEGTYTVSVDSLTADSDFNERLFELWNPTTPISQEVAIGPDSADNDFGFEADIDAVIEGIDNGDYPTTGKSYKWWRKEFLRVLNGNANTAYTEAELLAFAHAVEDLALLDEYDWTPGQELQQIYAILNNHAFSDGDGVEEMSLENKFNGRQDPYFDLLRELLTTELNHVSGRGLSDLFLQEVLVNWGEGILDNNPADPDPQPSFLFEIVPGDNPNAITSPEEGARLFGKINGATGGGGTN